MMRLLLGFTNELNCWTSSVPFVFAHALWGKFQLGDEQQLSNRAYDEIRTARSFLQAISFATKYYVSKSPPICSDNLNIAYQCNETFHKFLLVLQSTILRGRTLKWCLPVRHIKLLLFYGQKIWSLVCNEMNKFCYGKHKKHRVNVVKIIDKEIWRAWTFI